jgi:hypothetical protein
LANLDWDEFNRGKIGLKVDTETPARIADWRPVLDASECAPHWMRPQPRASEFLELVLQLFVGHLERIFFGLVLPGLSQLALVVGIVGLQLAGWLIPLSQVALDVVCRRC